jgi:hypothetical protein
MEDPGVVIALFALLVAGFALWRSDLRPFRLGILWSNPTFQVYTVRSEQAGDSPGLKWYIPSFDLSVTFWNAGARPGTLEDVRLLVTLSEGGTRQHETYAARAIVDHAAFDRASDRFEMIASIESSWYGVPVIDRTPRTVHLVLETTYLRWDEERDPFDIRAELQVQTADKPGWRSLGRYEFPGVDPFDGSGFILGKVGSAQAPLEPHVIERMRKFDRKSEPHPEDPE